MSDKSEQPSNSPAQPIGPEEIGGAPGPGEAAGPGGEAIPAGPEKRQEIGPDPEPGDGA